MQAKPQLHQSMLDMMSRCGIQFQRRYGARFDCAAQEEILPPGIALVTGSSVHKSVEANLRNKMENDGQLLEREQVAAVARDALTELTNGELMLSEEEAVDIKATIGAAVDQTVALATLHHDILAPTIQPIAVEDRWVIELPDYPFDLSGQIDIREEGILRDTKTAKASPPADAARSLQMGMYVLAEQVRGRMPKLVCLDYLVKTKTPKAITRETVPDDSMMSPVKARINRANEIIKSVNEGKGQFTPADPGHWCCTERFCGYARTCPFWSGR